MTGALVNILSVGRRRLSISVRFERVADDSGLKAERAYLAREARNALFAEQHRREIERYTTVSGLR
jgi:hypothetical protein